MRISWHGFVRGSLDMSVETGSRDWFVPESMAVDTLGGLTTRRRFGNLPHKMEMEVIWWRWAKGRQRGLRPGRR